MNLEKFKELSPYLRCRIMIAQKEFLARENCVGFSPRDWIVLTLNYPECMDWWYSPDVKLQGYYAARFYAQYPEKADLEVIKKFLPADWVVLLERQPQFAEQCDFANFTASDWASLLGTRKEFIEKFCISNYTGKERKKIVLAVPILADKTDFDGFTPYEWTLILKNYPELKDYYNWKELSVECRVKILSRLPDFANKMYVEDFSGNDWVEVLSNQATLERICDFSKLTGSDWVSLIQYHPEFAQRCNWSLLNGDDWTQLLGKDERKKYYRYCDFRKLSADNWNELLQKYPEWYLWCPVPEKLCLQAVKAILMRSEEIGDLLDLSQLSDADWVEILAQKPECYDFCDETFGVENFNVRQLLYLRHCMEKCAEDDILCEEYKEMGELYGEFIDGKNLGGTLGANAWIMFFNVPTVVSFAGRRYRLCEMVKPDYFRGFGYALAYPIDVKENDAGFIRCVRLKFSPSDTDVRSEEACGLEESNEWYSPEHDDFIDDADMDLELWDPYFRSGCHKR